MKLLKPVIVNVRSGINIARNSFKSRNAPEHAVSALIYCVVILLLLLLYGLYEETLITKIVYHFDLFFLLCSAVQYFLFVFFVFVMVRRLIYRLFEGAESRFLYFCFKDVKELFIHYSVKYFWWMFRLFSLIMLPMLSVFSSLHFKHKAASVSVGALWAVMFDWILASAAGACILLGIICVCSRIMLFLTKRMIIVIEFAAAMCLIGAQGYFLNGIENYLGYLNSIETPEGFQQAAHKLHEFEAAVVGQYNSVNGFDPFFSVVRASVTNMHTGIWMILSLCFFILLVAVSYFIFKMLYYQNPQYYAERTRDDTKKSGGSFTRIFKPGLFSALLQREYIYLKRVLLPPIIIPVFTFCMFFLVYRDTVMNALNNNYLNFLYLIIYLAMLMQSVMSVFPQNEQHVLRFYTGLPISAGKYVILIPVMYSAMLYFVIQLSILIFMFFYEHHRMYYLDLSIYSAFISVVSAFFLFLLQAAVYALAGRKAGEHLENSEIPVMKIFSFLVAAMQCGCAVFFIHFQWFTGIIAFYVFLGFLAALFYMIVCRFSLFET